MILTDIDMKIYDAAVTLVLNNNKEVVRSLQDDVDMIQFFQDEISEVVDRLHKCRFK